MHAEIPYDKIVLQLHQIGIDRDLADDYLTYLSHAISLDRKEIFYDYIRWRKTYLQERDQSLTSMQIELETLKLTISAELNENDSHHYRSIIEAAIEILEEGPDHNSQDDDALADISSPHTELARDFMMLLMNYKRRDANNLIFRHLENGLEIKDLYLKVFQPCQWEVGRLWQMNKISVGQEHFCTAATQAIMSQLYPRIFSTERVGKTLVATTIHGNLHEVGIRMVVDFFELEGWDTYYLGANTPNESILTMLIDHQADVLAISATLAPQVEPVLKLVQEVRQLSRPNLKVLVGGGAFNTDSESYHVVGADGWAVDAQQAVTLANQLVEIRDE